MLLRSHYKSTPGSECCVLKLMRFNVQGSEQGPSLAASCQHVAQRGATAPSRREAAGSQEGSWSAVRLLGSGLRSQGALQDPEPTRPRFPHRREMGGEESSNDSHYLEFKTARTRRTKISAWELPPPFHLSFLMSGRGQARMQPTGTNSCCFPAHQPSSAQQAAGMETDY